MGVCCCYCSVTKSCLTLHSPKDCSLPGSSSMGFPKQKYWSGLLVPSPGDLPNPGIEPALLHWQEDSLSLSHQVRPYVYVCVCVCVCMRVHECTYVCVYMHVCVCVYMHVCVYVYETDSLCYT